MEENENRKIEISTLNVSINILMLDNKRFTKSVFNQLPADSAYPRDAIEIDNKGCGNILLIDGKDIDGSPIGYVYSDSNYWCLYNNDGVLYKYRICQSYYLENKHVIYERIDIEKDFGQIFISC